MNDLMPLLLIGGAAYFFWPQLQSLFASTGITSISNTPPTSTPAPLTSSVAIIPGGTPPAVATSPVTTTVYQSGVPVSPVTGVPISPGIVNYNPNAPPTLDSISSSIQSLGGYGLRTPTDWINLYSQAYWNANQYPLDPSLVASNNDLVSFDSFWEKAKVYLALKYGMSGLRGLRGWQV